jgi:putative aldouronate transport system substrate-binding protein
MNKTKKFAVAAVSMAMASCMALSVTACTPSTNDNSGENGGNNGGYVASAKATAMATYMGTNLNGSTRLAANAAGWSQAKSYWEYLSQNVSSSDNVGSANLQYKAGTTINLAVGHNSTITSTSFNSASGDTITLPDGKNYSTTALKPAWQGLQDKLGVTFVDKYAGKATNANLSYLLENNSYNEVDVYTSDLSVVVEKAAAGTSVLNLADYLDQMPNFKAFLEANPVVYLSLLQDGMSTTDGSNKTIYVAPYFDGNDDIERYVIIRQDWASKILDGTDELTNDGSTFAAECAETTSATSYLGTTGKIAVDSTSADGSSTIKIYKNYDNALAQVKAASSALGTAYQAIAGEEYTGESGNIVDIMNAALAKNNAATGKQLVNLFRAYVDAAYTNADGSSYYAQSSRSNLFNGYDACWDADDLVAMLRCVKTNAASLVAEGHTVEGIFPRSYQNDRTPDMVRLAGQLYGVRGVDSRYEYTYIDSTGTLKDATLDAELYDALNNMYNMTSESLIPDYSAKFDSLNGTSTAEGFMMYDFNQTQTLNGFYATQGVSSSYSLSSDYNFAPIVNPVSMWSVNGTDDTTMRFTESWRSTKTSGLVVNGAVASDTDKLNAILSMIDYMYSESGQILMTYGPMSTNGNTADADGFWYADVATDAQIASGDYFTYEGVKYHGTTFKGKSTPILTDNVLKSFKGETVKGWAVTSNSKVSGAKLNFTNYARMLIGSTLPVGVKDQSFENQLTSAIGQTGASKVAAGLVNGTIKSLSLQIDSNNWWYTCVPTGLPILSAHVSILSDSSQDVYKQLTGTAKTSGDKNFYSIFNYIIMNGLKGTFNQQDNELNLDVILNG